MVAYALRAGARRDGKRTLVEALPINGSGLIEVQVVGRAEAASDAVTLWLARPGTREAPAPYRAGQFITLALPRPNGATVRRSYSLCGDGNAALPWEVTVKRQTGGLVSPYLCDVIQPGMVFRSSAPSGTFVLPRPLDRRRPIALIATGSGVTPMMGLLRALALIPAGARPPVHLHYAYHSMEDGIYVRDLLALDPDQRWLRQWHYVSTRGDRLTPAHVRAALTRDLAAVEVYYCGNRALRTALEADLRRHGAERIHVETFLSPSATSLASGQSTGSGAVVRLAESGAVLQARPGERLLDTLERCGYAHPSSCHAGACGTCRLKVLAGRVRDEGDALTPKERGDGYVLSCVAQPLGAVTIAGVDAPTGRMAGRPGHSAAKRKPAGVTLLRGTLLAASMTFFLGAGYTIFENATHSTQTSSSSSPSTSSSTSSASSTSSGTTSSSGTSGSESSGTSSTGSNTGSSSSSSGSTTLPSGPSSISSGSGQSSSSTHSSVS